jgi:predicted nicotinamide N-methyase
MMPDNSLSRFIRDNTAPTSPPLVPEIRLHLATEVTPLWHATESSLAQRQLPPPYWAFAWPGGQALARYVLDHREAVRGKRVVDVGAGSGLAAIAAAMAGACQVTAVEIDPFAVVAVTMNAALNGVAVAVDCRDLLSPALRSSSPFSAPFCAVDEALSILIGDMCYERELAQQLVEWLYAAAAGGAEILLGDPGRAYLPETGLDLVAKYDVPTALDLEDRTHRDTAVYRLRN